MTLKVSAPDPNKQTDNVTQPLHDHFLELRARLLWVFSAMFFAMALAYIYVEPIYGFLVTPLADAMGAGGTGRLIYTGLTEAFFTYLKVAFFTGVFVTFPIFAVQMWLFLAPGLYKGEKHALVPFLCAIPVLFFCGGATVYYGLLPMALPFFLSFQSAGMDTVMPIQLEARVSEYLDLIMMLIFAFGLCFRRRTETVIININVQFCCAVFNIVGCFFNAGCRIYVRDFSVIVFYIKKSDHCDDDNQCTDNKI